MSRAKMQVLIIPYIKNEDEIKYCIFDRADTEDNEDFWQFVAGGGENDENPLEAAIRETWEETGLKENAIFYQLESISYVPTNCFSISLFRLSLIQIFQICSLEQVWILWQLQLEYFYVEQDKLVMPIYPISENTFHHT